MTVKDLKVLLKKGHTIGCHTKTHANLARIDNFFDLKKRNFAKCKKSRKFT